MGAPNMGQKIGKAGPSPLRVSIGDQLAAKKQDEIITAPQEAQEEIVTKPGEVVDPGSKAEIEMAPTQSMPSSNPPPPEAVVIPRPPATPSTVDFIAAAQEPVKPRQVDSKIMTGDLPIVVEVPQTATPPAATPPAATGPIAPAPPVAALAPPAQAPTPKPAPAPAPAGQVTVLGHASPSQTPPVSRSRNRVQMLTLSSFTYVGRFRKGVAEAWKSLTQNKGYVALVLLGGTVVAIGIALLVVNVIAPQFFVDHPTTAESAVSEVALPTAPPETVTVLEAPVAPVPEPTVVVEPEPGFRGRVRAIARDAFPRSCLTAGTIAHANALYMCGPGQRNGADLCNCTVFPRR